MSDNPLSGNVGLDTTDFKAGIAQMNRDLRTIDSAFKASAAALGDWTKDASGLESRIKALSSSIDIQKNKVAATAKEYDNVVEKFGATSRNAQELQIKLNKETETLNKMNVELKKTEADLADMSNESKNAGKNINDLGDKEDKASEKTRNFGTALQSIGGILKATAIGIGSLAAAAAGLAFSLGKAVVQQFGELEQALGGSEAVFGQYAETIQRTGEDAYRNLGVSQADYLATANKMGALFQGSGLDQQKSLELTQQAMQRAADMASVMGIDTQMALDSIAGAAKGNFTMMDNLGVAMNATTVEAYALSKGLDFTWASATNAEKAEVAMQMFFENTSQYAGNFAKESEQTISGSVGMLQAALGSFTAGLGNSNADMTNLTQNLIDAFKAVVKNIVPVVKNIITAMPDAIDAILGAVGELLPMLLQTATGLFSQMMNTIVALLPQLIPVAVSAIITIVNALVDNLPMIISAGVQMVLALVNGLLPQLPMLIETALEMIITLANGLTEALPELIPAVIAIIPQVITTLLQNLPLLVQAALQLIMAIAQGLIAALPVLIESAPQIIQTLFDTLVTLAPMLGDAAVELVLMLVEGIGNMLPEIGQAAVDIIATLNQGLDDLKDQLVTSGVNMVLGIWEGISSMGGWLQDKVRGFFANILEGVKKENEEKSPSKKYAARGRMMAAGVGVGFVDQFRDVAAQIQGQFAGLSANLSGSVTNTNSLALAGVGAAPASAGGVVINVYVDRMDSELDIYQTTKKIAAEISRVKR